MKKLIFGIISIFMIFTLFSCSKKQEGDLLSTIRSKGKITIATEGAWAPWTYHDETNALVGYDVEVGKKLAEKLGVKAEFVEVDWDGIFAGIDAKRYDISCNGVEVTDERSLKYDFTEPYAYTRTALIVRNDNNSISDFADLKGKTTANSIGSTYSEVAERLGAKVVTIDSFEETLQLVEHDRADATLNDNATFYYYQKVQPKNPFKVVAETKNPSHVAIPLRKGSETATLKEALNKAIEELNSSGELKQISEKYFGTDLTK
ncbi:transporter substrate-binding domain-containing protein [Treponema pectinovorum]|uniref:transporter substrate-binding domain-containing protein n=1 Tax=Treponema pectinovorum TaxID=164 RepID=UPI0011CBCAF2|nr:transporter substrate-binding domain-containing protein [Treponema pectinovorum]